ncbi:MAG: M1 family metallopeptidase [Bryobacterales bacterium]|nr:M1 family metallopeptidase [Bryobacterales bacterium]
MRAPCLKLHLAPLAILAALACACICGCSPKGPMFPLDNPAPRADTHSYAKPEEWKMTRVFLDLDVDFHRKVLRGTALLDLEHGPGSPAAAVILDTRALTVEKAEWSASQGAKPGAEAETWSDAEFSLGPDDPILGAPLRIELPAEARAVRITYETSPGAVALQWLEPAQTAGKKQPFLFSQSQAIQARSWIPLQDSPGIRVTYGAKIRVPRPLRAVMSADTNPFAEDASGKAIDASTLEFRFDQPKPIPSYLIALAVGDLAFANLDPRGGRQGRTGVYAEPSVLPRAASEFADTEKMVESIEARFGPYRWGRYDLLILPPSFPFGGMENPCLTFATPTVIAGDKSLVSLVAHELAHSWSGNLVTNATWRDFWLNEGFTTYLERRILEDIYGKDRADMEAVLGYRTLLDEMKTLPEKDQILYVDLKGRDPDDGFTQVPYEKGALFLRTIEGAVGREKFDAFLRSYFDKYAFQSITTQDFLGELADAFFREDPRLGSKIPVLAWVTQPGIPEGAAIPSSPLLKHVAEAAAAFADGKTQAASVPFKRWSSLEQLHFLRSLPKGLDAARMKALDEAFGLTHSGNSEVAAEWLLMSVRNGYSPAYPRLESFLIEVGRRKFIKPLYEELVKTPEGRARALAIYAKARPGYHPMAVATVDGILQGKGK